MGMRKYLGSNAEIVAAIHANCERLDNGCVVWRGEKTKYGYGRIKFARKRWMTHRLVWTLLSGAIEAGLQVCHSCDNASCCNRAHLFLGTAKENVCDSINKNRRAIRERHGMAKLTIEEVAQIREMLKMPRIGIRHIAWLLGMSETGIRHIKNGKNWRENKESVTA